MINSIYGSNSLVVTTALLNRLYYAVVLGIPIIASTGTYLAAVISEYNLGIDMNRYDENFVGKIDDYIREFDLEKFQIGCQSFLN